MEIDENYEEEFYSVQELQQITGLSKNTIYRLIKERNIQPEKVGRYKRYPEYILELLKTKSPETKELHLEYVCAKEFREFEKKVNNVIRLLLKEIQKLKAVNAP